MMPIIQIFGLTIQAPLLAVMAGFAAASWLAERRSKHYGLDGGLISNALFYGLIAGVLGARIGYVALNVSSYARDPLGALALNTTALSPHMGWLVAAVFVAAYLWRKQALRVSLFDALAPAAVVFAMGLAVADFLAGSAYGTPTDLPWAISLWDVTRHPVQLYELIALVAILAVTLRAPTSLPDGALALITLALYACMRVLVDGFRADVPAVLGMRVTQVAGVVIALAALWMLGELLRTSSVEQIPSRVTEATP